MYYEVYDEKGEVIAAGSDLEEVKEVARTITSMSLVGQGYRDDGSTFGFIVGKVSFLGGK